MTKILNSFQWTKAGLDSAKFRIPAIYATNRGSILGKATSTLIEETGELRNKTEQTPSTPVIINGHKSTVSLIFDNLEKELYYQGAINSKHLGAKLYPEGLTTKNIVPTMYQILKEAGGIKISDQGYENMTFSDRDIKIDAEINDKQWHEAMNEIQAQTAEKYKKLLSMFHKDKTDKQKNTGFQYRNRGEGTAIRQPIKGYDKALDIIARRLKKDQSIIGYTGENIKRIEANNQTEFTKTNPVLRNLKGDVSTALKYTQTLENENKLFVQYLWETLQAYQITIQPKIIRDMSKEAPLVFALREYIDLTKQNDSLPQAQKLSAEEIKNTIKLRYLSTFGDKDGRSTRFNKIIENHWHIMTNQ